MGRANLARGEMLGKEAESRGEVTYVTSAGHGALGGSFQCVARALRSGCWHPGLEPHHLVVQYALRGSVGGRVFVVEQPVEPFLDAASLSLATRSS